MTPAVSQPNPSPGLEPDLHGQNPSGILRQDMVGGPGFEPGASRSRTVPYLVSSRVLPVPSVSSCTHSDALSCPLVSFGVLLVLRMRDTSVTRFRSTSVQIRQLPARLIWSLHHGTSTATSGVAIGPTRLRPSAFRGRYDSSLTVPLSVVATSVARKSSQVRRPTARSGARLAPARIAAAAPPGIRMWSIGRRVPSASR